MLKQFYVRVAQAIPAALPGGRALYAAEKRRGPGATWFASLGAIYHIDRMIALDIPWWNVAATRAVDAFLRSRPQARVFEFGSGASTIWLAKRAGSVTSVEHDREWAGQLRERIVPFSNIQLLTAAYDSGDDRVAQPYLTSIEGTGSYDLIVVDGRLRTQCLARALSHLKPDGLILFDDSGRKRYRQAIDSCGLLERRYHGLSYCVPYPDHTSLLSRRARIVAAAA